MEIKIDYSRDDLLTDFGKATLRDRYMLPTEKSPQDAFARAAEAYSTDADHAQRIYDYASKLWFMFASPILSNGGTEKGQPISCFLNYVPDSRKGLANHFTENGELASSGGGVGGYWGHIRSDGTSTSKGSKSTGSIPFMGVVNAQMLAFSQGTTRRGSYAAYQDISHPEIREFIKMRTPTGGDIKRKNLDLHHGVNITNNFMQAVKRGEKWDLIDPHSKEVRETVDARELWQYILETRIETGEPYIHYIDHTDNQAHYSHKKLGLKVHASNLCTEIVLPTNEDRTAVCCLSSVNLETYDQWKNDGDMVTDIIEFLDNVITAFINDKSNEALEKARYSSLRERSLGLGAMGFHAYLQSKNIPFDCALAKSINKNIFCSIRTDAEDATAYLGRTRGSCPDIQDSSDAPYPRRNVYLMAIAPNATSSIICGTTSPSVEPYVSNGYTHKTMSGSFTVRNRYLEKLLISKNLTEEVYTRVWKSIMAKKGSVQHLGELTEEEKEVFKTAFEIPQQWIIEHASDRQSYIDQAQSINLFFHPEVSKAYLHKIHFKAWEKGLKTLYYVRSQSKRKAESLSETIIFKPPFKIEEECLGCQG
jgi:ribonucleoside-diphosphate reductase alpha chain